MKRGFTLVEMLITIGAIAIMFLIVVPEMSNVSRKTKENEYQRFLSDVFLSTEAYIQKNIENYPNLNYQNRKVYVYFDELLNSGYLKSTIFDPKNDKSVMEEDFTVQVFVDENNEYKYKLYEERYSCSIDAGTEFVFDYTNGEQEFVAECDGTYKLETWGAEGGMANSTYATGGYGAYSIGNIKLTANDILYINVGGNGSCNENSTSILPKGGYNGGGDGGTTSWAGNVTGAGNLYVSSGGGATHISNTSGLLDKLNIDNVFIVSAGGGGAVFHDNFDTGSYGNGGHGGGYLGNNGTTNTKTTQYIYPYGTGGSQDKPGSYLPSNLIVNYSAATFGKGASGYYTTSTTSCGGGGGLYGGGPANFAGCGGGSSYIGNSLLTEKAMYCYNCEESSEEATLTISTTGTNELLDKTSCPDGYSSNPVSKCAKAGNGYVKITYLGN